GEVVVEDPVLAGVERRGAIDHRIAVVGVLGLGAVGDRRQFQQVVVGDVPVQLDEAGRAIALAVLAVVVVVDVVLVIAAFDQAEDEEAILDQRAAGIDVVAEVAGFVVAAIHVVLVSIGQQTGILLGDVVAVRLQRG